MWGVHWLHMFTRSCIKNSSPLHTPRISEEQRELIFNQSIICWQSRCIWNEKYFANMNEIFSFTSKNTNIKMCRWEKVEGVESYQLGQISSIGSQSVREGLFNNFNLLISLVRRRRVEVEAARLCDLFRLRTCCKFPSFLLTPETIELNIDQPVWMSRVARWIFFPTRILCMWQALFNRLNIFYRLHAIYCLTNLI